MDTPDSFHDCDTASRETGGTLLRQTLLGVRVVSGRGGMATEGQDTKGHPGEMPGPREHKPAFCEWPSPAHITVFTLGAISTPLPGHLSPAVTLQSYL